ncbi:hypothetical protein HOLleu_16807 [Holothuria leucospilota]|uniref:C2H2-type domain-containing protein n=1 Tax=Holothuria leucospilota TaxID=206669 RepID=A0A9Q1C6L0_HOLLE|nr:hypothetical protein HOLleu_16807 [Holothuria leucospilota]
MSTLYEAEYRCKVCKRRFSTITDMKRHHTEAHNGGGKLFKCSRCEYSSDKKSDLDRKTSRRHPKGSREDRPKTHRPTSSRVTDSPPRPQRLITDGWPSLSDIVGPPSSADDFINRKSPPTPNVSPVPERPILSLLEQPSTSGAQQQPVELESQASSLTASDNNPVEVVSSVREEATKGRGPDTSPNTRDLQERLSTVVFLDGRVFVTTEKFISEDETE